MKTNILTVFVSLALLVAACAPAATPTPAPTVDVNPIYTAAAKTVVAGLTATAEVAEPTATATEPLPTATKLAEPTVAPTISLTVGPGTPQVSCPNATFEPNSVDVNIPDGTEMKPGEQFVKTWRVINNGSCVWSVGYTLVYGGYADKMGGVPVTLTSAVLPGQQVEVSVQFTAPTKPGEYTSAWRMATASGSAFGKFIFVKIIVR